MAQGMFLGYVSGRRKGVVSEGWRGEVLGAGAKMEPFSSLTDTVRERAREMSMCVCVSNIRDELTLVDKGGGGDLHSGWGGS